MDTNNHLTNAANFSSESSDFRLDTTEVQESTAFGETFTQLSDDPSHPKAMSSSSDVLQDQELLPELPDLLRRSGADLRPTAFELQMIARYWYKLLLQMEAWRYFSIEIESMNFCVRPYAKRRLERILKTIGEQAFSNVVEDAEAEVRDDLSEDTFAAIFGEDSSKLEQILGRSDARSREAAD